MTEIPPQLRLVRDFFFKQASALPPERSHLHHPGLIENQAIFRLEDLRKHLNNPFLQLEFLQFVDRGRLVDMTAARCVKLVQRRSIEFINRRVLQEHLEKGAACLLEGVDILEPQVGLLASILDRAHSCTFSNAVVFFSQRGNEAYRGHIDTDDVLAIHLGGTKKWRLYSRQAPRRSHLVELEAPEMGPVETEIVMQPGDALFLRSGTPHQVETVGDYSLHLSFDLCDRAAGIETVLDLLLKHYDRDALRPYGTAQEVLEKVASLGRAETFGREFDALQQQRKSGYEEFRSVVSSRITFFDGLIGAEQATRHASGAAAG